MNASDLAKPTKRNEARIILQRNAVCTTGPWTIRGLLQALASRGQQPAVISFGDSGEIRTWSGATLAQDALKHGCRLRQAGVEDGGRVALWGPNSPEWIAAALGVLASGRVLVPIDDLADAAQLTAALISAKPSGVLTTSAHLEASGNTLDQHGICAILIDPSEGTDAEAHELVENLPALGSDAPAMLSWTSGTTGSPKAFLLTHGNFGANVTALRDLALVGCEDRALLPLPLHHAYPFVVGMLTPLTLGTAIVLPSGMAGPALMQALERGQVTAIVGVPRLYEALAAAIDARAIAHDRMLRFVWRGALRLASSVQRLTGLRPGRLLFASVRRRVAPWLRLLVCGGARLEEETEERLEALGWAVLSGYGLAETASLFTGNQPSARRRGSAGRPLAGGEIRVAEPDEQGIGEIELRGPSITGGYIDNPEANRAAFTSDGWFRTGDSGFVDRDGFLFVTRRLKEVLVLGGGKKVTPEDVERVYGSIPEVTELAILEDKGALVALVRPDAAKLRARGAVDLRDGIRVLLGEKAQSLPSYQRLSGFALTDQPLPRTRLGKYRRFLLPDLYQKALAGAARRAAHAPGPGDAALLRNPAASAVWDLLHERHPDLPIDFDTNLSLDLNLDSFGWMELTIALQDRFGLRLSETDIAGVETIRNLLLRCIERHAAGGSEEPSAATDIERWLAPSGVLLRTLGAVLYACNRLLIHSLFRLRMLGVEGLPRSGRFVITPNHVSYLDGLAIAAALPFRQAKTVYWAGDFRLLFSSPLARAFARASHVFPVDPLHPGAALDAANRVLEAGNALVWFPEAWRSPDGILQRFLPGIGELLLSSGVPAVPVYIAGAFEALPRNRRLPRFNRISVLFGDAVLASALRGAASGATEAEKVANALHERVAALGETAAHAAHWASGGPSGIDADK